MANAEEKIDVEVAYARPDEQVILEIKVSPASTVAEAIRQSGILETFKEIDLGRNKVGIFGRPVSLSHPLRAFDRVEIYRPLLADPKEIRRQRAAEGKQMKKGDV